MSRVFVSPTNEHWLEKAKSEKIKCVRNRKMHVSIQFIRYRILMHQVQNFAEFEIFLIFRSKIWSKWVKWDTNNYADVRLKLQNSAPPNP